MLNLQTTRVVQLFFPFPTTINVAFVVSDLQAFMSGLGLTNPEITWDREEIVILEEGPLKIVLGWGDAANAPRACHLTLGFEQVRDPFADPAPEEARDVHFGPIEQMVERITDRYQPERVLWCDFDLPLTADTLEVMADKLTMKAVADRALRERPLHHLAQPVTEEEAEATLMRMPRLPRRVERRELLPKSDRPAAFAEPKAPTPIAAATPANIPAGPLSPAMPKVARVAELDRIRTALYPDPEPVAARKVDPMPLRIAVQVLNLVLMVVWLPLGAAVMALACWRGGDIRMSAHALVVAGLFSAAVDLPGMMEPLRADGPAIAQEVEPKV